MRTVELLKAKGVCGGGVGGGRISIVHIVHIGHICHSGWVDQMARSLNAGEQLLSMSQGPPVFQNQ